MISCHTEIADWMRMRYRGVKYLFCVTNCCIFTTHSSIVWWFTSLYFRSHYPYLFSVYYACYVLSSYTQSVTLNQTIRLMSYIGVSGNRLLDSLSLYVWHVALIGE